MQSIKTIKFHLSGSGGKRSRIAGVEFAVYPVVMLVEGVHQGVGSEPAFYPGHVIAASASKWTGAPVPVGHPVAADGEFCLLSDNPALRGQFSIGVIDKPVSKLGRLTAEIAIDVRKAATVAPGLVQSLDMGGQMDVSTGLLAVEDKTPGVWKGEHYATRITEIIPDHLALLPGAQGACSWADGCGVRLNTNEGAFMSTAEQPYVQPRLFEKSLQAVEAATTALCKQHGDFQGRAMARKMNLAQLITMGETILSINDVGQEVEEEILCPAPGLFQRGAR
jgi:hypothetical protein